MHSRPPGASRGEKDEPPRRFASSGDVRTPGVTCRAGRDIKDGTQSRRFSAGGASRPRAAATGGGRSGRPFKGVNEYYVPCLLPPEAAQAAETHRLIPVRPLELTPKGLRVALLDEAR